MTRVVLLHGRPDEDEYNDPQQPSESNSHWFPWLQKRLLIAGFDVQTPEVFRCFEPNYDVWRSEFERHLVDEPMILVGHSTGGGFFIRWLSEHPDVKVAKLVLVAPYLDCEHYWDTGFFDFTIDDTLPSRVGEFHLFHSTDDQDTVVTSVAAVRQHFPNMIEHIYNDMGHFVREAMGTEEFPDLVKAVTG